MSNQILEKYDVAISYLSEDEDLAYSIYTELGEIFNIFIYTQHQDKLAGEDGTEILRDIFNEKSNLRVILYREGWGATPWTNTEEKAIQEFGLHNRWQGILLVNLDGSKSPKWFPETLFYLNYQQYDFKELIGAIKIQAEKRGSVIRPITAVDKAKILATKRELANRRKKFLNSKEGVNEALNEVKILFEEIERICDEITSGPVSFEHKKKNDVTYNLKGYKQDDQLGSVGFQVIVQWDYNYRNTLDHSKLTVGKVDLGRYIYRDESKRIGDLLYDFDVTPAMKNRWRGNQTGKLLTSSMLADDIVKLIIDFMSS